jgi:2,4-didehydro-3-deoxy-L-rhamnonate hydrolase
MKLVRYGAPGREKPGMIDKDGRLRDLSKIVPDIAGDVLSPSGLNKLRKVKPEKLPPVRGKPRIGACVGKVGNFIAIGLNYSDHAAEAGMPIPAEPIIFNKAPSCICGPDDDTMIPKGSSKLDWEVELGIVIGSPARYLSKENAPDNGPRARAARPSARSVPGSSPRTRSKIRRSSICGSTSTARSASAATPRP